jgi:hypothetical protein
MSIARFRRDADHLLRHFDLRRPGGRFEIQVDHVYSGDPVARAWRWTQDGGEAGERACAQVMVTLKVVAGRDWHVLDFADADLQHRRPQAGAAALGRARGEWHVFAFQGSSDAGTVEGGYMLFETAEDFAAARDELLRHDG